VISILLLTFSVLALALLFSKSVANSKAKPKKVKSTLSSSEILSSLAPSSRTPIDDLEEWWQANKSKDAKIRELEELVKSKSALIARLEESLFRSRRGRDIFQYHEIPSISWREIDTPTLSNPAKAMVLPEPMPADTPIVGLKLEGKLAEYVMDENMTTHLTVRGGRIREYSTQSWDGWI